MASRKALRTDLFRDELITCDSDGACECLRSSAPWGQVTLWARVSYLPAISVRSGGIDLHSVQLLGI